jgi:hypothetical protein
MRWRPFAHRRRAHRRWFDITAVLSLVLLVPLVQCYFYVGAVGCTWKISASPTRGERAIAIANQCGHINLVFADSPGGPMTVGTMVRRHGPFFLWTLPPHASWDYFRKTFWSIGYYRRPTSGETESIVHFPAWVLMMLCAIAPSLWIRRRLPRGRNGGPRGFDVELQEPSVQSR